MRRNSTPQDDDRARHSHAKISYQTLLEFLRDEDYTSGILRKRKKKGNWSHCYAVLHKGRGYFFWNDTSNEPFLDLYLQDTRLHAGDELLQEEENKGFEFDLTKNNKRFIFTATSPRDLEYWKDGFRKEIERANNNRRPASEQRQSCAYTPLYLRTQSDHYDEISEVAISPDELQRERPTLPLRNVKYTVRGPDGKKRPLVSDYRQSSSPVLRPQRMQSTPDFYMEESKSSNLYRNIEEERWKIPEDPPPIPPRKSLSVSSSSAPDEIDFSASNKQTSSQGSSKLVRVVKGKLAFQKVDVIVNTASSSLRLDKEAVSKSLLDVAGAGLQLECDRKYPNGIQVGDLAETSGCKLDCKVIYHGTLPVYASTASANVLDTFMKNCLQTANDSEFVSIAFPALGTGHLGYPIQHVVSTMYNCVETFFRSHPKTSLQESRFVVYETDFSTLKAFEEEQRRRRIGDASSSSIRTTQSAQDLSIESAFAESKNIPSSNPINIPLTSPEQDNENNIYLCMEEYTTMSSRKKREISVFETEWEKDEPNDKVDLVEAICNYDAEMEGDLSLEKGDIILVKAKNSSEWWTGTRRRDTGLFPAKRTRPVKKCSRDEKVESSFEDVDYLDPFHDDDNDNDDEKTEIYGVSRESKEYNDYFQKKAVPQILAALDINAVKTYKACLQDGIEKISKIRIIIVGQKESGKSFLTRRLLKESTAFVPKSNSLEIHALKCKARIEDGKWLFLDEYEYETNINERILTACCQNKIIIQSDAIYKEKENTKEKMNVVNSPSSDSIDEISQLENDLGEIVKVNIADEDTVLIEIWDLPGDEESCSAYLSLFGKNAVYIVTVNVTENMQDNDDSGLIFWPEFIRCMNKTRSPEDDDLSVFIVGTFKDKFEGQDEKCVSLVKCRMQDSTESRQHIKGYYVVSNVQELDDLDQLRSDIIIVSKKQAYWNLERPLRWIHLEKNLHQEMKLNVPVMSNEEMKDSVKKMYVPLADDQQLEQFLTYHHNNGTVVYLKCNPDRIILNPQWLANAMRMIIISAKYKANTRKTKELRNLQEYGKLTPELIDEIFRSQSQDIEKYKTLILNVMIRCHTIIRPDVTPQTELNDRFEFAMPSLICPFSIIAIEEKFTKCKKSSCLCLDFKFLPPTFTPHLLVSCTHLFNPVRERKKKKTVDERHLLFYHDVAVFEIDDTKCEKLMICRYKNVIQFQVWKWGDSRTRAYRSIKTKLLQIVDRLIEERSSMHIQYSIKVKCKFTEYDCLDGMVDFKIIQPHGEYYCDEHENSHSSDEVHFDWCGQSEAEECTRDQINAARMAIIIVDILGDVLYDRLVLDTSSLVKQRSECDITWLYSQLRNQNQHTPSRGHWGGEWKDIPNGAEKIGDDIERVRLTRNGMQHLSTFVLDDDEYFKKLKIIQKVVLRMENHNKKGTVYTDRVKEVAKRKLNIADWETYKNSIEIELPRLKLKPSFDVKIGDGCTLDCEVVVALPKGASIYWVKMMGDQETPVIVDAMKYKGSEVGYPSLIILNSSKDDEGYYSCRIEYPVNCAESGDQELTWPKTFLHVH